MKLFQGNQHRNALIVKWVRRIKRITLALTVLFLMVWSSYFTTKVMPAKADIRIVTATTTVSVETKTIAPVLKRIADCESGNGTAGSATQFGKDGQVIMHVNDDKSVDEGKYMINLTYHGTEASKMGLDLAKEKDNETFALYLYENKGTTDWMASYKCWK